MPLIRIHSPDDPRVAPYRDLRRKKSAERSGRFIAEGELLVRRLLQSSLVTESLLVADNQRQRVGPLNNVPVYVAASTMIEQIAGFRFHRGLLGCGLRPASIEWSRALPPLGRPATVVACSAISDAENLGGLLRNCAAFDVDLVLVDRQSADPFSRRALRVSMGAVLKLQVATCDRLDGVLRALQGQHKVECFTTVLDPEARPLCSVSRPPRRALIFGNEFHGVGPDLRDVCRHRVTIPMSPAADSLNVAVASGIFLYHFCQSAERIESA
jgi:tRNA G18 (ribose-2'-O)-methylase SpoU